MIHWTINFILCSGCFFVFYKFLLEGEKMSRFNRFYLLASILLSIAIPFISIETEPASSISEGYIMLSNSFPVMVSAPVEQVAVQTFHLTDLLMLLYCIVALILLIRFVRNIAAVISLARSSDSTSFKNVRIVLSDFPIAPYSFLRYIFLDKNAYKEGRIPPAILMHEYAHLNQRHSYDILLIELVKALLWFNPILIFYGKAIRMNHEFLADESVLKNDTDPIFYQQLLISQCLPQTSPAMTSNFDFSITKKRLIMLSKSTPFGRALLKGLAIIPILAGSIFLFAKYVEAQTPSAKKNTASSAEKQPTDSAKKQPVNSTEKQPENSSNPFFLISPVPSTAEGVSEADLSRYEEMFEKTMNEKGQMRSAELTTEEKDWAKKTFFLMTPEQQNQQIVIVDNIHVKLAKIVPTQKQLTDWSNPKMFGVWLDGKKIKNSDLKNYKPSDISHYYVSKLYGKAKTSVNYYYQVNLETNASVTAYNKKVDEDGPDYRLMKNFKLAKK